EAPAVDREAVDPAIERLRAERKERYASGMEIAEQAPEAQPFLRCAICEADNSRFAEKCMNCGAPLTTDEQRTYNEALWAARRADRRGLRSSPALSPVLGPRFQTDTPSTDRRRSGAVPARRSQGPRACMLPCAARRCSARVPCPSTSRSISPSGCRASSSSGC